MSTSRCPDASELERLLRGELPEDRAQQWEDHLRGCQHCVAQLKVLEQGSDALGRLLRQGSAGSQRAADDPAVPLLLTRLKALRQGSAVSEQRATMSSFACPRCAKKLAVAEGMAGKKVKCPGCAAIVTAPAPADVPAAPGGSTQADSSAPSSGRSLPAQADLVTPASSGMRDATIELPPPRADAHLTEFLAPAENPDELGRLGKYRILAILGHGGMGVVYKAEDPLLKRPVALKAMLPALAASASAGQRFLREAQTMAAVGHEHVVRVFEVAQDRNIPFLAMEFLEGEPLDARLEREGTLPLLEVLQIGKEIAEGLAAAHQRGLIHRDIKPGNIWLEAPKGRVKVLDFGLARSAEQESGLTQQGAIVGTPAYMAPEQGRGDKVDARCDLFSLGVILYRLSCGKAPFVGQDMVSTLMAIALQQPPAPVVANPELPPEVSDLIMQLLEKDRDKRPANAAEVAQRLGRLERRLRRALEPAEDIEPLASSGAFAKASLSAAPAAGPRRRAPVLIAVALLLVGLAGAGMWGVGLIRFTMEQGDLVLQSADPDFAFSPVKDGAVTLEDRKAKRNYQLRIVPLGAENYQLEVLDKDADLSFHAEKFTVKRGDKIALSAWFERKAQAAPAPTAPPPVAAVRPAGPTTGASAEQIAAARWVLDRGGGVIVRKDGKEVHVKKSGRFWLYDHDVPVVNDLPALPFTVVGVFLNPINNPDLKEFGDADLARLGVFTELEELNLSSPKLTAVGLTHCAPLQELRRLSLFGDRLDATAAAATVRGLAKLEFLFTNNPVWLRALEGMPSLRMIRCHRMGRAADYGRLKSFPNLCCVFFSDCELSEQEIALAKDLKKLRLLLMVKVKLAFADDALERLATEMPACEIRTAKLYNQPYVTWNAGQGAEAYALAAVQPPKAPIPEAWFQEVAKRPAAQQLDAVAAKLKERNIHWDGKLQKPDIQDGVVIGVTLSSEHLSDLAPLQAWPSLKHLHTVFSPQRTYLSIVQDLSPLAKLKLTHLALPYSFLLTDLTPLRGMPLEFLDIHGTGVANLEPLQGMPLVGLKLDWTRVVNLAPLKGMPLKDLGLKGTKVVDLTPLAGMPLEFLRCEDLPINLAPLKGLPLRWISCPGTPDQLAVLRSIKTLEKINDKPTAEFWKEVDAAK
jgi:phage FluMu protein Com